MKRIFLPLLFLAPALVCFSQRTYFIFLQTDNQQPFFVKMDEKIISSTSSGYLILSRLRDTTQHFSIGFPGQDQQYNFYCTMNHKDHGYMVKNFGNSGWGLFDIQTLGIQMASKMNAVYNAENIRIEQKESNAFTDLLSQAANDTTLNQKVVIVEPVKEKPVQAKMEEKKTDTVFVSGQAEDNEFKADTVENKAKADTERNDPLVKGEMKAEPDKKTSDTVMTFAKQPDPVLDTEFIKKKEGIKAASANMADTMTKNLEVNKILQDTADKKATGVKMPDTGQEPVMANEQPEKEPVVETGNTKAPPSSKLTRRSESSTTEGMGVVYIDEWENGKKDTIRILVPKPSKPFEEEKSKTKTKEDENLRFLDIRVNAAAKDSVSKHPEVKSEARKSCTLIATDSDFFTLRRDMAAQAGDEAMINTASKVFATKCFSTEQVKNLSSLFLSDKAKLDFFTHARLAVTDKQNLSKLESELSGEDYKASFRQLISNQ